METIWTICVVLEKREVDLVTWAEKLVSIAWYNAFSTRISISYFYLLKAVIKERFHLHVIPDSHVEGVDFIRAET